MLVENVSTGRTKGFTVIVSGSIETGDDVREALKALRPQIDKLKDCLERTMDAVRGEIYLASDHARPSAFSSEGIIQWRQEFYVRKTRATTWNQISDIFNMIRELAYAMELRSRKDKHT